MLTLLFIPPCFVPRATARRFFRRMQPRATVRARARRRVPAVGRWQPQIGCVRGASGLSRCCCRRQLVGPMAGPHVQRQGRWRLNVRQL